MATGTDTGTRPRQAPRATLTARVVPLPGRGGRMLIERNLLVYKRGWVLLLAGAVEPMFYLFSIGVGLGQLVGGISVGGHLVPYRTFVAPALLATAAMNGALVETTFNVFFRLKFAKLYTSVLATPMAPADIAVGEIGWALIRGGIYSAIFLVVMAGLGLIASWWALLALPAALLLGAAFAALGMALTTFMRGWQDFEFVTLAQLPLFLFSATFYPLSVYPGWLQLVVRITPLYQGVALVRGLTTGDVGLASVGHAAYLVVLAAVGVLFTARRLAGLLLR